MRREELPFQNSKLYNLTGHSGPLFLLFCVGRGQTNAAKASAKAGAYGGSELGSMIGGAVGPPVIGNIVGNLVGERIGEAAIRQTGSSKRYCSSKRTIFSYW